MRALGLVVLLALVVRNRMARGFGEVEVLTELSPDALSLFFAIVTQAGSLRFVPFLIALVYLRYDRRGAVVMLAALLVGTGSWMVLKDAFALARPATSPIDPNSLSPLARAVYDWAVVDTGYGFPSGHAVTATVVYLLFARTVPFGTRRLRYAVAGTIIGLVCLSRIALGVHFLVDVLAGALVGLSIVGGVIVLVDRYPRVAYDATFATAAGLSLLDLVVGGGSGTPVFACIALSAYAGWQLHELRGD